MGISWKRQTRQKAGGEKAPLRGDRTKAARMTANTFRPPERQLSQEVAEKAFAVWKEIFMSPFPFNPTYNALWS